MRTEYSIFDRAKTVAQLGFVGALLDEFPIDVECRVQMSLLDVQLRHRFGDERLRLGRGRRVNRWQIEKRFRLERGNLAWRVADDARFERLEAGERRAEAFVTE